MSDFLNWMVTDGQKMTYSAELRAVAEQRDRRR
jgi:hypothetical protein